VLRRRRALAVLLALALFTNSAEASRLTPSVRSSNVAHTAGAQSFSVSIPPGATEAIIEFYYYNDTSKQDPASVSLDGIGATNRASAGFTNSLYIAIYTVSGFSTGSGKVLSYTVPSIGIFFAMGVGIEFRNGSIALGASDAASSGGSGPASTSALSNSSGDEILSAYASKENGSISPVPGSGQSKLDEVDDSSGVVIYGFTTETGTGTPDIQTIGADIGSGPTGNIPAIASIVLHPAAGPTIPPGSQAVVLTSIATGSPVETFNATVSPDIAPGDYMIGPMLTTPSGCTLSLSVDGNLSYQPVLGDVSNNCDTVRQSATITFWDTSVGGTHADTMIWWDNNRSPAPANAPGSVVFKVPLNSPMTPTSLIGLCTDADGDTLTYTSVTALPANLVISNNVLSGTATTRAITPVTFRCTDIAGAATDFN
jgi:hypothetical protein